MKDELISYETAVLAKEKDFDEKTNAFYREDRQIEWAQYYDSTPHNSAFDSEDNWFSGREKFKPIATAPTQSLLQKWLREKHQIHIQVDYGYLKQDYSYCVVESNKECSRFCNRKTYEEALEEGLQEGLKLINI